MRKAKRNWKWLQGLCCALALTLLISLTPGSPVVAEVAAADTLPKIAKIADELSGGKAFTVLEIVPEGGTGSIGYYAKGWEPGTNWRSVIAGLTVPLESDAKTFGNNTAGREKYANDYMQSLVDNNLLGTDDSYPLTKTGSYSERLPWEHEEEDGFGLLDLSHTEQLSLNAKAVRVDDNKGDLNAHYEYSLYDGEPGPDSPAEYAQDIEYFTFYRDGAHLFGEDGYVENHTLDENETCEKDHTALANFPDDYDAIPNQTDYAYLTPNFQKVQPTTELKSGMAIYQKAIIEVLTPVPTPDPETSPDPEEQGGLDEPEDGDEPDDTGETDGTGETPDPETTPDPYIRESVAIYQYCGTLGVDGFYLQGEEVYYFVAQTGAPAVYPLETEDEDPNEDESAILYGCYVPVVRQQGDGFRNVKDNPAPGYTSDPAYFTNQATDEYDYVGEGGAYELDLEQVSGAGLLKINYDHVYIQGGYENNHWFLRYVLDMDTKDESGADIDLGKVPLTIRSVSAANVTESAVNSADLIVLSAGFRPNGGTVNAYGDIVGGITLDIREDVAQLIYECASLAHSSEAHAKHKIPVIVDRRIAASAKNSNMQRLARFFALLTEDGYRLTEDGDGEKRFADVPLAAWNDASVKKNFAAGNFYVYSPTPGAAPGFDALATRSFAQKITNTDGFAAVIEDISYENFLRQTTNSGITDEKEKLDTLPEDLTMANTIRYIINYGEGRNTSTKESIRILELQGGTGKALTEAVVRSWLPELNGIKTISITTMSTYEFVGKLENLNETYDLVYIGASTTGVYNSSSGRAYFNIGDAVTIKSTLLGLLNSEYTSSAKTYINGSTGTARRPGNDITPAKQTALENFIAAGYPVVLENNLVTATQMNEDTTYRVVLNQSRSSGTVTLTASLQDAEGNAISASDVKSGSVSYRWYSANSATGSGSAISGATGASHSISTSNNTSYYRYCIVTVGTQTARSATQIVSRGTGSSSIVYSLNTANQTSGTLTRSISKYLTTNPLNTALIDNCTRLYKTLDDKKNSQANVMTVTEAKDSPSTLLSYLNLSKPQIDLHDGPEPYAVNGGAMTALTADKSGKYHLEYSFTIVNHTDATPTRTTYDVALYYDQDGDGRFTDEEELTDIVVRSAAGPVLPVRGVYQLKAGVAYTLTRQIDIKGIIPWKLKIVKTGKPHIHSSATGYTRVAVAKEEKTALNVLQILPTAQYNSITVNLSTHATYKNLLTNSKDKEMADFDIKFTTCYANGTTNNGTYNNANKFWDNTSADTIFDTGINKGTGPGERKTSELADYDMLVIGFADCYDGIDAKTAEAIIKYIESGRAVLFTHDLTSIQNVANSSIRINSSSGSAAYGEQAWGYSFNQTLRDYASMDIYGITSDAAVNNNTTTIGNLLAGSGISGTLTTAQKNRIAEVEKAGYSIAYEPNSNKTKALAQTHGFATYALDRWKNSGGANPSTTTVTQVNAGQITTYPFNINSAAFGGTKGNTLSVTNTHGQYYQLNLNTEDIVVWFTLSGGNYSTLPNDVASNYYIFNKGNITYSGVGHSAGVTEDEAKLFLNTMIAAYRTGVRQPEVELTNEEGVKLEQLYFVAGKDSVTNGTDPATFDYLGLNRYLSFKISDVNTSQAKQVSISFAYQAYSYDDAHKYEYGGTNEILFSGKKTTDPPYITEEITPSYSDDDISAEGITNANVPWITTENENSEWIPADHDNINGNTPYRYYLPGEILQALWENDAVILTATVTTSIDSNEQSSSAAIELRKIDLLPLS